MIALTCFAVYQSLVLIAIAVHILRIKFGWFKDVLYVTYEKALDFLTSKRKMSKEEAEKTLEETAMTSSHYVITPLCLRRHVKTLSARVKDNVV